MKTVDLPLSDVSDPALMLRRKVREILAAKPLGTGTA